jgi:hypothetical protein
MKKIHLRRYPRPSSLRRTHMHASFLRASGALHLDIFAQPSGNFAFQKAIRKLNVKFHLTPFTKRGKDIFG